MDHYEDYAYSNEGFFLK